MVNKISMEVCSQEPYDFSRGRFSNTSFYTLENAYFVINNIKGFELDTYYLQYVDGLSIGDGVKFEYGNHKLRGIICDINLCSNFSGLNKPLVASEFEYEIGELVGFENKIYKVLDRIKTSSGKKVYELENMSDLYNESHLVYPEDIEIVNVSDEVVVEEDKTPIIEETNVNEEIIINEESVINEEITVDNEIDVNEIETIDEVVETESYEDDDSSDDEQQSEIAENIEIQEDVEETSVTNEIDETDEPDLSTDDVTPVDVSPKTEPVGFKEKLLSPLLPKRKNANEIVVESTHSSNQDLYNAIIKGDK